MPLIKSPSRAATSANIREMAHAGKPHAQAVAAALRNARQYGAKFASGGFAMPWTGRAAARSLLHDGFINSAVPGRTDKLPISVAGGAYVVPSSHVAALGQDNSLAGANVLNKMFRMGPYGSAGAGAMHGIKPPVQRMGMRPMSPTPPKFASGGASGEPIKIIAAGGEFVVPPHKLIEKFGSLKKGHAAMDNWIVSRRKKHAKTLAALPGPKKD